MSTTKPIVGHSYLNANISGKDIRSGAWYAVFKILKDNLTNPKGYTGKWIWSSYPDEELTRSDQDEEIKSDYPIIVLKPITERYSNDTLRKMREYTIPITIEIYSDRSDYLSILSDDIGYIIEDSEDTFNTLGLDGFIQVGSDYSHFTRSGVKIQYKAMRYEAKYTRVF
jgi:hypothetical protein